MKLFTKEIDTKLFAQYPLGNDLKNQKVIAKIFNPYGRGTWYIINSDPNDPDYLWAIVNLYEIEVGSVSRKELENLKVPPFGLPLERDMYYTPVNAANLYRDLIIEAEDELTGESEGERRAGLDDYEDGGKIDIAEQNKEMLLNYAEELEHHTEEFEEAAKKAKNVEPWVIAKIERSTTDLSDVTHYLDSENEKRREYGEGEGEENEYTESMKKGGKTESEELVYIEYFNKDKKFAKDRKEFKGENAYKEAISWGRKNIGNFNADMVKFKMANGGTVYEDMRQKQTEVKFKIASVIGIDTALEYLDKDFVISPFNLITSAVFKGFITVDEINQNLWDAALSQSYEIDEIYRDSGDGIGSSDMNAFISYMLNDAGVDVKVVDNKYQRMAEGGLVGGLTADEAIYLYIKRGIISKYREKYLKPAGLWKTEKAKEVENSLIKKGFLNDAGAINQIGKDKAKEVDSSIGLAISREYISSTNIPSKYKEIVEKFNDNNKMAHGGSIDLKNIIIRFKSGNGESYIRSVSDLNGKVIDTDTDILENQYYSYIKENDHNNSSGYGKIVIKDGKVVEYDYEENYGKGGEMGVDKHRIYFSSLAEVIDAIYDIANENGYEVVDIFPDLTYGGISYGQTKKVKVELKWNGKEKVGKSKKRETNTLNVSIYRMDSGNYELVSYFAYEYGGMMADGGGVEERKKINGFEVNYFKTGSGVYANIKIPQYSYGYEEEPIMIKGFGKDEKEAFNDLKKEYEKYLKKSVSGIKSKYIVTFGFYDDGEYRVVKSKPISANSEDDAAQKLQDQFESLEGIGVEIINVNESMASGGKVKFADKVKSIKSSLLKRKKVSPSVQKDYGKTYSPKEAEESAKRIVGAMTAKERLMKKRKK